MEQGARDRGIREGDWQCPNPICVNNQRFPQSFVYGTKVNCPKCGTGRNAQRPGDWCCPNVDCVNHANTVYGSKAQCSRCGAPRPTFSGTPIVPPGGGGAYTMPTPAMQNGARPGDWHCPNESCKNFRDNLVYSSKAACPLCGTPKPETPTRPQPSAWRAPHVVPPTVRPSQPPGSVPPPPNTPHPGFFMQGAVPMGAMFPWAPGGPMPPGGKAFGKGSALGQPGDWHCPNSECKNHTQNVCYASKENCPLCGSPKPDTGVGYSTKKHEGDWPCPNQSCKNHTNYVYASKAACTMCGTPNPNFGVTEDARARSRSPRMAATY